MPGRSIPLIRAPARVRANRRAIAQGLGAAFFRVTNPSHLNINTD